MARTYLVRNFLDSVLITLQDISPPYERWTEVELVRYLNFGQMAIATYLPHAGSRVDAIKLAPGTRQDLTQVLAANLKPSDGSAAVDTYGVSLVDVVRSMGQDGQTPGRIIRRVDQYTKDTNDPDWHTRTAPTPTTFIADGRVPKTFYVSPGVPSSPAVWVEVKWMAAPNAVPAGGAPGSPVYLASGGSTATLGIDDQFVDDLRNYVLGMAYLKGTKNEGNAAKAALHTQAFTGSINAKAAAVGAVNPNLTALPYVDQAGLMGG